MTFSHVLLVGVGGGKAATNPHLQQTLQTPCHFDAAVAAGNPKKLTTHQR